jgi:hypothetical protein
MSLMTVYLKWLLFSLYVTDGSLMKSITVLVVWHWWRTFQWWRYLICNIPTRSASNNSSCVYAKPHSDTFSWFRANKFLLLCISAACANLYYYCSCCMTLMNVYLSLLLFVLHDTNEGLLKISIVRVLCHWWSKPSSVTCNTKSSNLK